MMCKLHLPRPYFLPPNFMAELERFPEEPETPEKKKPEDEEVDGVETPQ